MSARRPWVGGNWKMHRTHLEALHLVQGVAWALPEEVTDAVDVVVLPPFTALRSVQTLVEADRLALAWGAQDLSPEAEGAHTGDVSGPMLAALGCTCVVVGHSERRTGHAETDADVAAKAAAAFASGLTPVLCLGETEDVREAGDHVGHCVAQLDGSTDGLSSEQCAATVVAYEPVWAIGTGKSAGPDDAQEICAALRARLAEVHGQDVAEAVRIVYGGSVKPDTAAGTFAQPDVDGALVGGASLSAEDFSAICRAAA